MFQCLALACLAIFYGCYFGKMLLQKRKGIQTYQIGKGKSGTAKQIEIVMKIATILVPFAEVISIAVNTTALPYVLRIAGLILAVLGDLVFIVSVMTMRDSWRAGVSETEKTSLVTNGIYHLSRNPAFLGFDLIYLGVLLMFFNVPLLLFSLFAAVMFHVQIVFVEEPFLMRQFGHAYQNYTRKTRRYLGCRNKEE